MNNSKKSITNPFRVFFFFSMYGFYFFANCFLLKCNFKTITFSVVLSLCNPLNFE